LQAWLHNRASTIRERHAHYRFTDPQLSLLTAFLGNKTDSDLLANVHLDAATPSRLPTETSGHRLRLRFATRSAASRSRITLLRIDPHGSKPLTQILSCPA